MQQYDVLVIGAGPAGSAAALACARRGLKVGLADRSAFPRDKVCGDALIPDSFQALEQLQLLDHVLTVAHRVSTVRIYAPNGRYTTLHGDCACLPRAVLDDLLRSAATEAGAEFLSPLRALGPLEENGVVVGARFERVGSKATMDIRAATTILATGAAALVLQQFGVCLRRAPSATAARLYVQVDERTFREHDHLCVAYAAGICPGYGWIFPGPDRIFNVGVGYVYGRHAPRERNVRSLLNHFLRTFPPAAGLMKSARAVGPLKGAPLRTAMQGARFSRPGVIVVGEAAGLTYSFSGEGIGKAMQSGILAAEVAVATTGSPPEAAAETYAARLPRAFGERVRAYQRLQQLVAAPVLANALIWRANSGTYVQRQLEALLNETGRADELLSLSGMARALLT